MKENKEKLLESFFALKEKVVLQGVHTNEIRQQVNQMYKTKEIMRHEIKEIE